MLVVVIDLVTGRHSFNGSITASAASPWRRHLFDADYPQKIFDNAVANGARPIYLADAMTTPYIQAYWYATLKGIPLSEFVRLEPEESPPANALVISTEEGCSHPHVLARTDPYRLYIADAHPRARGPLPDGAFRAEISVPGIPATVPAREAAIARARQERRRRRMAGLRTKRGAVSNKSGQSLAERKRTNRRERRRPEPATSGSGAGSGDHALFHCRCAPNPATTFWKSICFRRGVTWFGLKGSRTYRARITVVGD